MSLKASALKSVKKRKLAEKIVLKAMRKTGRKYADHFEQKKARALPADPADARREMLTKEEIFAYRASEKAKRAREATNAYCAFNVLEALVSVVGLGDDINAIIRVCPPPRDGEAELACQVDAAILVTWVGNAAARLAHAVSNCATTLNVNAVCAVGVTGLVAVLGELASHGVSGSGYMHGRATSADDLQDQSPWRRRPCEETRDDDCSLARVRSGLACSVG